jgi:hypothetical protein
MTASFDGLRLLDSAFFEAAAGDQRIGDFAEGGEGGLLVT